MLKENEKLGILEQELELVNEKRAIVFVNTKRSCDIVSRHLDNLEYRCTILHGGKTQVGGACPTATCLTASARSMLPSV